MGILFDRRFLLGLVAGLALVYAYHHFMAPLPGTGKNPGAKRAANKG